jgi:hypothetical protein
MSRETFIDKYRCPFFMLDPRDQAGFEDPGTFGFVTVLAYDEDTAPGLSSAAVPEVVPQLFAIAKSDRNVWQERILVGRSTNNDVVIRDRSVSKLHAIVRMEDESTVQLADHKSTNGTSHRGRRLDPGETVDLRYGDLVHFGLVAVRFIDAGAAHAFVTALRGR